MNAKSEQKQDHRQTVAQHYDKQTTQMRQQPQARRQLFQIVQNTATKDLITHACSRHTNSRVLELCIGKGGALMKYIDTDNVSSITGVDIAQVSLQECARRYMEIRNKRLHTSQGATPSATIKSTAASAAAATSSSSSKVSSASVPIAGSSSAAAAAAATSTVVTRPFPKLVLIAADAFDTESLVPRLLGNVEFDKRTSASHTNGIDPGDKSSSSHSGSEGQDKDVDMEDSKTTQTQRRALGPFDIVSCQFALHYAAETQTSLRDMLALVSKCLCLGGHFILTTVDANMLRRLRGEFMMPDAPPQQDENGDLIDGGHIPPFRWRWSNGMCEVTAELTQEDWNKRIPPKWLQYQPYHFKLEPFVDGTPQEYVIDLIQTIEMAREYGLRCDGFTQNVGEWFRTTIEEQPRRFSAIGIHKTSLSAAEMQVLDLYVMARFHKFA